MALFRSALMSRRLAMKLNTMKPVLSQLRTKYTDPSEYRWGTMNDLPVPEGSWQEHHDRLNKQYNIVLVVGIATLAATVYIFLNSGLNLYSPFPTGVLSREEANKIFGGNYKPEK